MSKLFSSPPPSYLFIRPFPVVWAVRAWRKLLFLLGQEVLGATRVTPMVLGWGGHQGARDQTLTSSCKARNPSLQAIFMAPTIFCFILGHNQQSSVLILLTGFNFLLTRRAGSNVALFRVQ